MMESTREYAPDVRTNSPSASNTLRVDVGKAGWAYGFAFAALMVAFFSWWVADKAEREARMLEYYVNETDQLLVSVGLKKPGDSFLKFKQQQESK